MTTTKKALEITCTKCASHFRLWVPEKVLRSWEDGSTINCVSCAEPHKVTKLDHGFEIEGGRGIVSYEADTQPQATRSPAPDLPATGSPVSAAADLDTVLFIEDERLARKMIENSLQDVDVTMIVVKNSTEALHTVSTQRVNLIVTDLYLKDPNDPEAELDGEDFLKRVVDSGVNIPAIITTGKDIIDDIVLDPKWFDLHVKGFIQKGNPFWIDELKLKIKEILYKD